jgi:radical SAM protein with 4Fe4S-binding SPASM domain
MNVFTNFVAEYFSKSSSQPLFPHQNMMNIISVLPLMTYEQNHYFALRVLANEFFKSGFISDSYKIISNIPYSDLDNLISIKNQIDSIYLSKAIIALEVSTLSADYDLANIYPSENNDFYGRTLSYHNFTLVNQSISHLASQIVLFGRGEVFLHPEIYDILSNLACNNISIETYGQAPINIQKVPINKVKNIFFTLPYKLLYGPDSISDYFTAYIDSLKSNISFLCKLKESLPSFPNIILKVVFNIEEIDTLSNINDLISPFPFDYLNVVPITSTYQFSNGLVFNKNILNNNIYPSINNSFVKLNHKSYFNIHHCQYHLNNIFINVLGGVSPCSFSQSLFGNIFDRKLNKIYLSSTYKDFRTAALSDNSQLEICRNCHAMPKHFGQLSKFIDQVLSQRAASKAAAASRPSVAPSPEQADFAL